MNPAMETGANQEYNLYDYWYILHAKRKVIYLLIVSAVLIATVTSLLLPSLYEARAVFFVPARSDILTLYSSQDTRQVSRSPLLPESRGEAQIIYLGLLDSDYLRERIHAMFPQKSVSQIKRNVDFRSGTNFQIKIHVRDSDPKLAMDIANAYVSLFNETLNGYSLKLTTENKSAIEKELEETQKKLHDAKRRLIEYKAENRIAMEDEELKNLTLQRAQHLKSIEDTALTLLEISKKLDSLRKQYAKEVMAFSKSSVALSNPLISNLKQQISDLEAQIASAKIEYKGPHPEVEKLQIQYDHKIEDYLLELQRIEDSKIKSPNTLIENLRQEIVHLEIEQDSLLVRKTGIEERISQLEQKISNAPKIQINIHELNLDIDLYQKHLETLQVNLEETMAQERRNINNAVVVDAASLPDRPIFPNLILNIIMSFFLAIIAGIVYAFVLDFVDRMKLDIRDDLTAIENESV
ncbi:MULTISPECIES: GumC family protein [Methylomonas]|uniref:GumC family protein n=1 Tax=Methylomonas TaxID=416 RepID=UPI001232ADB0|nr:GNVR domain-containing protein [Methylomonas rhizoryzae]